MLPIQRTIRSKRNSQQAVILQKFFKTGKGEYGEGDKFLGLTVPTIREIVKKFRPLTLKDTLALLESPWHEERFAAVILLTDEYKKSNEKTRARIVRIYIDRTDKINNWDLVDVSAPQIIGDWTVSGRAAGLLDRLSNSGDLWRRRIAVLATFAAIRSGKPKPTLKIAKKLLSDRHDLIHKSVGWMLREVGKRCGQSYLTDFLDRYSAKMPRTMLRYSIERLPEKIRRHYLSSAPKKIRKSKI